MADTLPLAHPARGPDEGAPVLPTPWSIPLPPPAPSVLVVAPPPTSPTTTTPTRPTTPTGLDECQACGACCFSPQEHYVRLSGADHGRLSDAEQAAYTVFLGNRCFMRMERGRCAALADVPGGFACQVYERRPQLCRDYELAGPACAVDRERQRLPVLPSAGA